MKACVTGTPAGAPGKPGAAKRGPGNAKPLPSRICMLKQNGKNWVAYDDVTGLELDANKVYDARLKEVEFVHEKKVWSKIRRADARRKGWKVLKGRWVDVNKGDDENPNCRSRLVGKEFNTEPMDGLFAGTPPLEAMRYIIHEAATARSGERLGSKVIMINDVARAFFEAPAVRNVCVEIPKEDRSEADTFELHSDGTLIQLFRLVETQRSDISDNDSRQHRSNMIVECRNPTKCGCVVCKSKVL